MSIKITKPLIEIPVNGNDYKLKIDLNDQTFIENFINLIVKLTDKIFGEGSILKIFGIECPTEDLIMNFLIQIELFVNQAVEMKIENIKRQENTYQKLAILQENLR